MTSGAAETQAVWNYATSILAFCCAGLFVISALAVMTALRSLQRNRQLLLKNDSLVELLLAESRRHTTSILALNERLSNQYYVHQEKVSIEHVATLRELLASLSPQGSKTEGA